MRRLSTFFLGFLLGAVTVYFSLHYHVVRADNGLHLIPKLQSTFGETYVDIRGFGIEKWQEHKFLAMAITRAGKTDLVGGAVVEAMPSAVDSFFEGLNKS